MRDLLQGAVGPMLVFEGLLPMLYPGAWRAFLQRASMMSDGQICFVGLTSAAIGTLLLALCR